jgi:hypothetical protein
MKPSHFLSLMLSSAFVAMPVQGQSYKRFSGFFKPACVLIFLEAYFDSYKQFKCLNFSLRLKKSLKP